MTTVGVYKTDVTDKTEAGTIANVINRQLPESEVSFDLDDCDKVLRIERFNGEIDEKQIRNILEKFGRHIEPLPFEV
jgi:hypothetical protein